MIQIEITGAKRFPSYVELSYRMVFLLPAVLGTGASPIKGLNAILTSYPDGFSIEVISPEGTVIIFSETVSVPLTVTLNQIKNQFVSKYTQIRNKLDALTLTPYDTIAGLTYDGTAWI